MMAARRTGTRVVPLLLVTVVGLCFPATRGAAAPATRNDALKVFVFAGQSNMAGRGPATELPEAFRTPPPRVHLDYVCSFGASDRAKPEDAPKDTVPPEPHRSSGWVKLTPAPKHLSTPGEHFGPEIGFGHAIATRWTEQRIAIIKHGRGATSLAEDWAPDATAGRRLYRDMLAQVEQALARLKAEGVPYEICAFVWCQGEADTTREDWAQAYERNLAAFFARVRKDLAAPELPIVFSLTGDGRKNPKMPFPSLVRRAQQNVAARDRLAMLVMGDDLPLLDHVHYDAGGQLQLGQRLAEAYLNRRSSRP
jgi:hypothetical protein